MENNISTDIKDIYLQIKDTLIQSRKQAYTSVNSAIIQAYWQIGKIIVEHEQNGNQRAEYGKAILQDLSYKF